jgi:hypothetical protein
MRLPGALLLVAISTVVALAEDYPARNVTFIVPTGAGARLSIPAICASLRRPARYFWRVGDTVEATSRIGKFQGKNACIEIGIGSTIEKQRCVV